jgi:hypothetical protein
VERNNQVDDRRVDLWTVDGRGLWMALAVECVN